MDKRLEKLEQSLDDLRKSNRSAWNTYGSELCAGGTNSTNKRFLL